MKTFLKVIAWIGFGIFSSSTIVSFSALIFGVGGVDFTHAFAFLLAIIGVPLMLLGGLITRPKYFWLASITVSSLFVISFYFSIVNLVFDIRHTEWDYLTRNGWLFTVIWRRMMFFIPGIAGIVEGILIRQIETKVKPGVLFSQ